MIPPRAALAAALLAGSLSGCGPDYWCARASPDAARAAGPTEAARRIVEAYAADAPEELDAALFADLASEAEGFLAGGGSEADLEAAAAEVLREARERFPAGPRLEAARARALRSARRYLGPRLGGSERRLPD